jgi:hypothetical protein
MKIGTKNYDIFVYEKEVRQYPSPEELQETADLTRKFVKFLKDSKLKVPKFISKIEKIGNAFSIVKEDETTASVFVSAKDRIKSYGGDKSIAFLKCLLEGKQQMLDDFIKESANVEAKGSITLRSCTKCAMLSSGTARICSECGGTMLEFPSKAFRVNGLLVLDYPFKK